MIKVRNNRFIQLPKAVMEDSRIKHATTKLLAVAMYKHLNDDGRTCTSPRRILKAEALIKTDATYYQAINELVEYGYIVESVQRFEETGEPKSTEYILQPVAGCELEYEPIKDCDMDLKVRKNLKQQGFTKEDMDSSSDTMLFHVFCPTPPKKVNGEWIFGKDKDLVYTIDIDGEPQKGGAYKLLDTIQVANHFKYGEKKITTEIGEALKEQDEKLKQHAKEILEHSDSVKTQEVEENEPLDAESLKKLQEFVNTAHSNVVPMPPKPKKKITLRVNREAIAQKRAEKVAPKKELNRDDYKGADGNFHFTSKKTGKDVVVTDWRVAEYVMKLDVYGTCGTGVPKSLNDEVYKYAKEMEVI